MHSQGEALKYKIIYADPPWSYNDKASAGERGACYKYSVLGTKGICALPVAGLADDDCVLFMWATFPMLPDAFQVMKAWGFDYKTVAFVWNKTNKKADTDFFGMGYWASKVIRKEYQLRFDKWCDALLCGTVKNQTKFESESFSLWVTCPASNSSREKK
jgi:N6-adenosine-specific RNA methylase IME4